MTKSQKKEAQKQHDLSYSFKFDTMGSYNYTSVSINIKLPFRRLHLIYTLPALILREYWYAVHNNQHPTKLSQEETLETVHEFGNDCHEHMKEIETFTKFADCFKDFPHLKEKPAVEVLYKKERKLTIMERLTGICTI